MERWRAYKDEAAFAWFMARYWPCLLDYARCFVDSHDAQDIVQETFMYLWEKDPEVRSTSHLVALLRRVVHNLGLNRVHKTRRHVPMNSHALELILHTPAQDEQRGCRDDLLQAFIEALHTDDREILEWRYIEGAACSVIAARLGISLRGAHRKLAKSRQRLIDEAKRVQSP